MNVRDYYPQGKRWWVRLHEKGGKRHEMEPDQDRGWCEVCERGTLVSGLVLGGLI